MNWEKQAAALLEFWIFNR